MGRRVVPVFFVFIFCMGFIVLRLFTLITGKYAQAVHSTLLRCGVGQG